MSTQSPYILRAGDLHLSEADTEYILTVQDLPEQQKPREKLLAEGAEALTVVELLAVVLGVGTKKEEVMRMSSRIIKEYGNTSIAYQNNPKKLAEAFDIPITKACQIVSCFELGKRYHSKPAHSSKMIRTAKQASEYFSDMRSLDKEQLRGVYLNSRHRIVHDEVISIGSLTTNIVHPREVFRPALEHAAVAVILAHNHPSGTTEPTPADLATTVQIVEAGKVLGIKVLDHLIITRHSFKSIPVDYA